MVNSVKTMKAPSRFLLLLISVLAVVRSADAQIVYDMSNSTQFTSNFYTLQAASGTLAVSGGTLQYTTTAAGSSAFVYDTTPDTTATSLFQSFTTSLDVDLTGSGSSIGIYFGDGGTRTSSLLALLNLSNTGTADTIRFFSGANMTTAAAGTQAGTTTSSDTAFNLNGTYLLTLNVSYLGGGQVSATMTLTDPNNVITPFSASYTYSGIAATSGEIGYRAATGGASSDIFDNLSIPLAVPEPSTTVLTGLGVLALTVVWRRRLAAAA